jgi:hypothetical protein
MGAFDDLIPKAKEAVPSAAPPLSAPGGAFGDLIPGKPANVERQSQGVFGTIDAAVRGAADAATFGFMDEIAAGLGAATGIGGTYGDYEGNLRRQRGLDKADEEVNKVARIGGQLAGGIGTGVGLARNGVTLMRGGMSLPVAVGAGALEGTGYGAAYGAGSAEGALEDRARGAKEGAWTGALIGGAVPIVARGIGAAARPLATPPERQVAVDVFQREGIPMSAGQRTGSKALRYSESFLGDAPLSGGQATRAAEAQGEAFTGAAMRRIGAEGRATPENLSAARDRIGGTFNELSGRNALQADPQLGRDLGTALTEYSAVLPSEQRQIVGNIASDIVQRVQQGGGTIAGRDYQTIRSRLSRMAQNARVNDPEFSQAIRSMRDALDEGMTRSINGADAEAWNVARQQWGNLKTLERAASGAGESAATGLISPQQLRVAASSGAGNRGAYARGQGDFAELARAGNVIMDRLPNSGTAQRNLLTGQIGGGSAAAVMGDPLTAAIISLGPGALGRALWAGPVQRFLAGETISPMARQAIESRVRAALQGGAQSQGQRLSSPSR